MRRRRLAAGAALALALAACSLFTDLDGLVGDAGVDAPADASDASDARADADASEVSVVPACNPTKPFGAPKRIDELESAWNDDPPRLRPDGLSGFFGSDRTPNVGSYDLYEISRGDAAAPFVVKPLASLNSGVPELQPSPTGDGLSLYFTGWGGQAKEDLHVAQRVDGGYGNVASLGNTNTGANDAYPYVRPDGTVLYLASDRSGTSWDLYYARINDGGVGAANALPELNGADDETAPVVSPDELTIFFARYVSGSKSEIFMATRASTSDKFGASALVAAVNGPSNDVPGFVTADGCTLYFSSDRSGGFGSYDVYVATRGK